MASLSLSSATSAILLFLLLPVLSCAAGLTRATTCLSATAYFTRNALSRVGPNGFNPDRFGPLAAAPDSGPDAPIPPGSAVAPDPVADSAAGVPVAGVDFSGTNVQVEGVDELDTVKTDGRRVFTLSGYTLLVTDVLDNGAAGAITGRLELPLEALGMLTHGDSLLVVANDFGQVRPTPSPRPGDVLRGDPSFLEEGVSITVLYRVDVSGSTPRLVETLRMSGFYISSREVDGVARVVIKEDVTELLPFLYPNATVSADKATIENKKIIENVSTETWLPRYWLASSNCLNAPRSECVKEGLLTSCDRVFTPGDAFGGFSTVTVVTVSLIGSIEPRDSISIVSDAQEMYTTATSMYVTTQPYQSDFKPRVMEGGKYFSTTVHKFELGMNKTKYIASREVEGSLLNQYAMHEYNGTFFIATSEGTSSALRSEDSNPKIIALVLDNGELVRKGEARNLGAGKRIFAVRYSGSIACVSTSTQADPLYFVDLSNASMLRVMGKLQIPGFSSYLHPVGSGRFLSVGQEAAALGNTTGLKVTLFDMSDLSLPTVLSTWTLPGGSSDVEWDPRAFLYWEPESVAIIPVSARPRAQVDEFLGSVVLKVCRGTITEQGRVSHPDIRNVPGVSSLIARNLILSRKHLWSLSGEYLQINNISTLKVESVVPLGTSIFNA